MLHRSPRSRPRTTQHMLFLGCLIVLLGAIDVAPARARRPLRSAAPEEPVPPGAAQANPQRAFVPMVGNGKATTSSPGLATDQALIAAALTAGRIDYGTSLLYRAYALFSDSRLPREYWGAGGSEDEDSSLFLEAHLGNATLSAEIKSRLRPFLVRPDDPASVYNQPRPANVPGAAAAVPCAAGWASQVSAQVPLKVWACRTGNYAADLAFTLAQVTPIYLAETALMGPPKADTGGSDAGGSNSIDLYLLDPGEWVSRRGEDQKIPSHAVAGASISPTFDNRPGTHTASGFMLLGRHRLHDIGFRSDVAHEFFHILQFGYNYRVGSRQNQVFWWDEASAEWAAAHFVRETAREQVHPRFTVQFQDVDLSLHSTLPINHPYAAYIWPFFMEQEGGPTGAQKIRDVWDVLRGLEPGDWDGAMDVINTELPFAQHFHRFALRNLNSDFDGDNPLGKRYVDLDPQFPDNRLPTPKVEVTLPALTSSDAQLSYADSLPSLRAHYYHFRFADDVRQVTFDFSNLGPAGDRKVGAVVKITGQPWKLLESVPEQLHFCRNTPEGNIEDIWFVVGNHNRNLEKKVSGAIEVRPLEDECSCNPELIAQLRSVKQWQGTITMNYSAAGAGNRYDIRQQRSASVLATLNVLSDGAVTAFIGSPTGTASVNDAKFFADELHRGITGTGPPVPYDPATNNWSRVNLAFWWEDCEYNFGATIEVNATFTAHNSPATQSAFDIGGIGSAQLPLTGLELAGSAAFPAHSIEYILENGRPFFDQADADLISLLGEDNLGAASVTWRFTPVGSPTP